MKHLRETFTEREFKELKQYKKDTNMNWHDFLLVAARTSYPIPKVEC